MDRLDQVMLMVLGVIGAIVLLIATGCGGSGPTMPEAVSVVQPAPVVAAPATTQPVPVVAALKPWEGVEAHWEGSTAVISNVSDVPEWVTYCVYDLRNGFEAQGLPVAERKVDLAPREAEVRVRLEDVYTPDRNNGVAMSCEPTPSPSPSPTPTPPPSVPPTPTPVPIEYEVQLDVIHGPCGVAPYGHGGHNYGATIVTVRGGTRLVCPDGWVLYQPKCVQTPCPAICVKG